MSLTKWFKEDWRDVKTGKKCGRSGKDKIKNTFHDDGSKSVSKKRKNIKKKNTKSTADVGRVYSPTIPSQNGSSAVSSSNKNLTIFSGKTYSPNSTVRKPNKIEV